MEKDRTDVVEETGVENGEIVTSVECVRNLKNNQDNENPRILRQPVALFSSADESLVNHCILDEVLSEKKKILLESAVVVDFLKLQMQGL